MPIYAYRCLQCGAEPEFIHKMSDPPPTVCETCSGELVRKVTAAAFHLKGGGWYKDGYASAKPEGGDKPEGGGESKPESKPAESKPAESKPSESSAPAAPATPKAATP